MPDHEDPKEAKDGSQSGLKYKDKTQDYEDPKVTIVGTSPGLPPITKLRRRQRWWLVILNILLLVSGQSTGLLLARFYYQEGGHSIWAATLAQNIGFPILFIPYILFPSIKEPTTKSPITRVFLIYLLLGCLIAFDNLLYSIGLLYLSTPTYSLICATELAFTSIFSFYINWQRFTPSILNSIVILSLSASIVVVNKNSSNDPGVNPAKYSLGFVSTLFGSAIHALFLTLTQLSFRKYIKKETFSVVLELQIYTSIVASCASIVGLFASSEWRRLSGEVEAFGDGSTSYIMTLAWTAMAWQVCSVGLVGLIFVVSSLFSNAISTFSLAITPLAGVFIFNDEVNGAKIIAMFMGIWGFSCYIYQNCLDDVEVKNERVECDCKRNECPC